MMKPLMQDDLATALVQDEEQPTREESNANQMHPCRAQHLQRMHVRLRQLPTFSCTSLYCQHTSEGCHQQAGSPLAWGWGWHAVSYPKPARERLACQRGAPVPGGEMCPTACRGGTT